METPKCYSIRRSFFPPKYWKKYPSCWLSFWPRGSLSDEGPACRVTARVPGSTLEVKVACGGPCGLRVSDDTYARFPTQPALQHHPWSGKHQLQGHWVTLVLLDREHWSLADRRGRRAGRREGSPGSHPGGDAHDSVSQEIKLSASIPLNARTLTVNSSDWGGQNTAREGAAGVAVTHRCSSSTLHVDPRANSQCSEESEAKMCQLCPGRRRGHYRRTRWCLIYWFGGNRDVGIKES